MSVGTMINLLRQHLWDLRDDQEETTGFLVCLPASQRMMVFLDDRYVQAVQPWAGQTTTVQVFTYSYSGENPVAPLREFTVAPAEEKEVAETEISVKSVEDLDYLGDYLADDDEEMVTDGLTSMALRYVESLDRDAEVQEVMDSGSVSGQLPNTAQAKASRALRKKILGLSESQRALLKVLEFTHNAHLNIKPLLRDLERVGAPTWFPDVRTALTAEHTATTVKARQNARTYLLSQFLPAIADVFRSLVRTRSTLDETADDFLSNMIELWYSDESGLISKYNPDPQLSEAHVRNLFITRLRQYATNKFDRQWNAVADGGDVGGRDEDGESTGDGLDTLADPRQEDNDAGFADDQLRKYRRYLMAERPKLSAVLALQSEGKTPQEIQDALGLSRRTTYFQIQQIRDDLKYLLTDEAPAYSASDPRWRSHTAYAEYWPRMARKVQGY